MGGTARHPVGAVLRPMLGSPSGVDGCRAGRRGVGAVRRWLQGSGERRLLGDRLRGNGRPRDRRRGRGRSGRQGRRGLRVLRRFLPLQRDRTRLDELVELRGEGGGELVVVVIARIRGRGGSRDGLLVHGGNGIGGL